MEVLNYTTCVHPAEEGGYWAEVPALPGCFTQGETLEKVMARVPEAIQCHLAGLLQRGEPLPVEKPVTTEFAFPVSVRVPRLS